MRSLRSIIALALGGLALLTAGCGGPEVHEPDVIRFEGEDHKPGRGPVKDVRVEIRNYVDEDLEIEEVAGAVRDGRLSAQFRLVHGGDEPLHLQLTWTWLDADGIALRAAAGGHDEQSLVLQPGEDRSLTRTAPRPGAVRIECRVETRGPSDR